MKYRIVQRNQGYNVQKKFLGLFWIDVTEDDLTVSSDYGAYISDTSDRVCLTFYSIEEAKEYIQLFTKYPIRYRGHKIKCYCGYDNPYYVDMSSWEDKYWCTRFIIYDKDIEQVKKKIDEYEEKEFEEKHKRDIINIIEV